MARDWKTYGILLFILLLGTFLRFYRLPALPPGLYPDEAMNGNNALEALHGAAPFMTFYPENNGREGLFINIQAFFLNFFINQTEIIEPWMLRVPSALFGIVTLLGVFLLTRKILEWAGEKQSAAIPLLATFFVATSFWHINFSRIGFRAIMAPFFLTWGLYLMFLALQWMRERDMHPFSRILSFVAGFVYGLGFHSYIAYRISPLLILGVWIFLWIEGSARKRFLNFTTWFILGATCAVLPLIIFFVSHPADFLGRTSQISIFSSATPLWDLIKNIGLTVGSFFIYGDGNWRHNIAGKPLLALPVALFFLTGILLLVKNLWDAAKKTEGTGGSKGTRLLLYVSAGWILYGMLPVVISNEGIPHALRSLLIIPPIMIASAVGCTYLFSRFQAISAGWKQKKIIVPVLSVFLLFLVAFDGYRSYFHVWADNPNTRSAFAGDYVRIAKELSLLPAELPKYIVVDAKGTDVRGLPMPTQTVMFLTDTFLPYLQTQKNIHYILPENAGSIPPGSYTVHLR